ncbi:MAG: ORF6N domain-containing protein [Treponema sp.]|jgi:hypothetical protein|nr:ORF6N domain-containing protein [Treponema sp.]
MVVKKKNGLVAKKADVSPDEKRFFTDISAILDGGRSKAYAAVNFAMTATYWEAGKRIVEQEQHGRERANLKNIRRFYLAFQNDPIGYTVCSQLSWSHIRLIMRLDSEKARHYYLEVMLDRDLAELYQVETRVLNQTVKRNIKRFPEDFMFQLSNEEFTNLISQNVTSSWGGVRKPPVTKPIGFRIEPDEDRGKN